MAYGEADKVIKEIFESLLSRYQIGLEAIQFNCCFANVTKTF